ncbi:MAG: amino acid permease, partial [Kofleriaceae bacterium]
RTFGYPVTPIAFIALSGWIAYAQIKDQPLESAVVGLVLLAGAVVYAVSRRGGPPAPVVPAARVHADD